MDCPESLLQWESQVSWWVKDHWRPAARKLQPLENNDCIGRVPSPNQIPFNSTLLFGRPKLHVGLYGCAPLNNPPKQQGAGRVLIRNSTRAYSRTCPNKAKPCQAATNLCATKELHGCNRRLHLTSRKIGTWMCVPLAVYQLIYGWKLS